MKQFSSSILLAFVVSFALFFLSSCDKNEKSPEEQLKGKWVVSSFELVTDNYVKDSVEYSINLNKTNDGAAFSTNAFPVAENVKGNWRLSNDTIWFDYVIPNFSNPVDLSLIHI